MRCFNYVCGSDMTQTGTQAAFKNLQPHTPGPFSQEKEPGMPIARASAVHSCCALLRQINTHTHVHVHVHLGATETCARVSSLRKLLQVQDKGVIHSIEPFLSFLQVSRALEDAGWTRNLTNYGSVQRA